MHNKMNCIVGLLLVRGSIPYQTAAKILLIRFDDLSRTTNS
jgi:hypothetical protein